MRKPRVGLGSRVPGLRKAARRADRIYFIQAGDEGPIKIGYSGRLHYRLQSLATACPWPPRLLLSIAGTRTKESRLHRTFAEHRLNGEWFEPVPELLDYIEALRGGGSQS